MRRIVALVSKGVRLAASLGYDLGVLVGAGLVAYGLNMIHPALAPIWLGLGILFVVARAARAGQEE